jgi:hypothetical protein
MFKTSKAKPIDIKIRAKEQDLTNLQKAVTDIAELNRGSMIQKIHKVFRNYHDALDEFQTHIAHLLPRAVRNNPNLKEYFPSSRAPMAGEDGGGSDSSSAYRRSFSITEDEASDTQSSMDGDLSDDDLESAGNCEEEVMLGEELQYSTADKSTQTSGHDFTNIIVGDRGSGTWLGTFPFASQYTRDISELKSQLNNVRFDIEQEIDRNELPVDWVYIGLPCGGAPLSFMEMIWKGPEKLCHAVRKKPDDKETGVTGEPSVQAFRGESGHARAHLDRRPSSYFLEVGKPRARL